MGFGIKKKIRNHTFGVKRAVHRTSKFGSKAIAVGEVLFPEFAPELELSRQVLKKVKTLTKEKSGKAPSTNFVNGTSENFVHSVGDKQNNDVKFGMKAAASGF